MKYIMHVITENNLPKDEDKIMLQQHTYIYIYNMPLQREIS